MEHDRSLLSKFLTASAVMVGLFVAACLVVGWIFPWVLALVKHVQ